MRETTPSPRRPRFVAPLALLALAALAGCADPAAGADAGQSPSDGGKLGTPVVPPDAGPDATVAGDGGTDPGRDAATADAAPPGRPFYVIGGQDLRRIISADGKTWTDDTYVAPNGLDNAYSGAAIGNGAIVLSGDSGVVRSTDGHTWTAVTLPVQASLHGSQIVAGAGVFVMVAHADAFVSTDGATWKHAAATGDSGHWQRVAQGGGHWVALGDGHIKASEDGLTWHDYNATADPNPLADVAYGNGVFVAVGTANGMARIKTSKNGVAWQDQAPVTTSYQTGFGGIAFGNGVFVTSDCCNAFESTDGVAWTKRGRGAQAGIVFAGGVFVGAGWRTEAYVYDADAGAFASTLHGDQPSKYDAGLAPWFTTIAAGEIP